MGGSERTMLIHLYSNQQTYGDCEVWCGSDEQYKAGEVESAADPGKATCLVCLTAAHRYGQDCIVRKNALLDTASRATRSER